MTETTYCEHDHLEGHACGEEAAYYASQEDPMTETTFETRYEAFLAWAAEANLSTEEEFGSGSLDLYPPGANVTVMVGAPDTEVSMPGVAWDVVAVDPMGGPVVDTVNVDTADEALEVAKALVAQFTGVTVTGWWDE
jgi:hypothetical protein